MPGLCNKRKSASPSATSTSKLSRYACTPWSAWKSRSNGRKFLLGKPRTFFKNPKKGITHMWGLIQISQVVQHKWKKSDMFCNWCQKKLSFCAMSHQASFIHEPLAHLFLRQQPIAAVVHGLKDTSSGGWINQAQLEKQTEPAVSCAAKMLSSFFTWKVDAKSIGWNPTYLLDSIGRLFLALFQFICFWPSCLNLNNLNSKVVELKKKNIVHSSPSMMVFIYLELPKSRQHSFVSGCIGGFLSHPLLIVKITKQSRLIRVVRKRKDLTIEDWNIHQIKNRKIFSKSAAVWKLWAVKNGWPAPWVQRHCWPLLKSPTRWSKIL